MNYGKDDARARMITKVLLAVYLLALVWILLFKLSVQFSYMGERRVNFIPFRNPLPGEIVMNMVIFVPLGMYAGVLFRTWSFVNKLVLFLLVSLVFEALQFFLRVGAFDSTDLITNTVGGLMGWGIFATIEKACRSSARAHRFINIMAVVATGLMTLFLVLLKMDLLPIRYK